MKLRNLIIASILLCVPCALWADSTENISETKPKKAKKEVVYNEQGEIIKTGYNYGPLPAVAFDADKGFQLGALLNIYDFRDGSTYPNPQQTWYFEASFFTKGSQLFVVSYDNKFSIPGVRFSSTVTLTNDKAMDFYGFNGYMSYYDANRVALGKDKSNHNDFIYTPKYRVNRLALLFKADFTGNIWNNKFFWEAGYHLSYIKQGYNNKQALNLDKINKNKADYKEFPAEEKPIFDMYRDWGIISEDAHYVSASCSTPAIRRQHHHAAFGQRHTPLLLQSGLAPQTHTTATR